MSDPQSSFLAQFPNALFLSSDHLDALPGLLRNRGWIAPDETVTGFEKPGEGNMNFVIRVKTTRRSFVLKQARPWVEKYPQVAAPANRVATEARFYELVAEYPALRANLPGLVGYDAENLLLALDDLGPNADFTNLYLRSTPPDLPALRALAWFLSTLHSPNFGWPDFPSNQALKRVNHEHIFEFPYRNDAGFDLDSVQPGLQALANPYRHDGALKTRIRTLGEVYLGSGPTLLHGDFYPGSWLQTAAGPKVIDPEFAYFGRAEYDLGVMLAHLRMARIGEAGIAEILSHYQAPPGFDPALAAQFSGAEVLRRLLGLAQLPTDLGLEEKAELLATARRMVLEPLFPIG